MSNIKFDAKILSSGYINFLFGAGVNGSAFPTLSGFEKTNNYIKSKIGAFEAKPFEELLKLLPNDEKIKALKVFTDEFKEKVDALDLSNKSINNIEELMKTVYRLVYESENRKKGMKQINIFTLNYDLIVEMVLGSLGFLCNYVSASNLSSKDKLFDIIGHDYTLNREIPTFFVSKIHGDISDPVLPGSDKYDSILAANKFEIVFKMKEKLLRYNSILFVIGYSGMDEHINRILKDCVDANLTIYWFKYNEHDYVPESIANNIFVIDNYDGGDTTLLCNKMIKELWAE